MHLVFLIFTLLSSAAWGQCQDLPGGQVHYCVFATAGSTNPDVIYYFHGRFGEAEQWEKADYYTAKVREEWRATGKPAPKVVSVSFGPVWLLAEKNASPYSGMFEIMRDQVIPAMEQVIGGTKGQRLILGESMGGFNGLQLALKTTLFHRAAILCAPIAYGADPFSTVDEINYWIQKSAAYAYYGEGNRSVIDESVGEMITMANAVWQNRTNWQKSDPLILAAAIDKSASPMTQSVMNWARWSR